MAIGANALVNRTLVTACQRASADRITALAWLCMVEAKQESALLDARVESAHLNIARQKEWPSEPFIALVRF